MGRPSPPGEDDFHHANVWPAHPAAFEATWSSYYRACEFLADRLLALFALALELPADHFEPTRQRLRTPSPPNRRPGRCASGPTPTTAAPPSLYRDETPGGLEVIHNHNQRWEKVPDVAGTAASRGALHLGCQRHAFRHSAGLSHR